MTEYDLMEEHTKFCHGYLISLKDLLQRDDAHHRLLQLPTILDDGIGRHKVHTKPQLLQPGGDVIGFHHDISFPVIGVRDFIPTSPGDLICQFEIFLADDNSNLHAKLPFFGFRDFFLVLSTYIIYRDFTGHFRPIL